MDSFKIIRHIIKTMKKYGVKADAVSHDTPVRVISVARRSLIRSELEEMIFFKSGDRWGVGLRTKGVKNEGEKKGVTR